MCKILLFWAYFSWECHGLRVRKSERRLDPRCCLHPKYCLHAEKTPSSALASLLIVARPSVAFNPGCLHSCGKVQRRGRELAFVMSEPLEKVTLDTPTFTNFVHAEAEESKEVLSEVASQRGITVGIDLGTTNSAIAVLRNGSPDIVSNRGGGRTTPSTVAFMPDGEVLVGEDALKQAAGNVANTFHAAKRFIGRSFREAKPFIKQVGFSVINDDDEPIFNSTALPEPVTPEEVSAQVLRSLLDDVEDATGKSVDQAVITVPAYFDERQRFATRTAAAVAGLTNVQLLVEPVAACLAHRLSGATGCVLVFDLGAGTFDVSVLRMRSDGTVEVIATSGDPSLGGNDFDEVLVKWLAKKAHKLGHPVREDPEKMRRLMEAAEAAKIELSEKGSVEVPVPTDSSIDDEEAPKIVLHQGILKELCEPLFLRLKRPMLEVALTAGVTLPGEVQTKTKKKVKKKFRVKLPDGKKTPFPQGTQIDEVILVGGATKMQAVQKFLTNMFDRKPRLTVDAMEAVALGAAVQAGVLSGEVKNVRVLEAWQSQVLRLAETGEIPDDLADDAFEDWQDFEEADRMLKDLAEGKQRNADDEEEDPGGLLEAFDEGGLLDALDELAEGQQRSEEDEKEAARVSLEQQRNEKDEEEEDEDDDLAKDYPNWLLQPPPGWTADDEDLTQTANEKLFKMWEDGGYYWEDEEGEYEEEDDLSDYWFPEDDKDREPEEEDLDQLPLNEDSDDWEEDAEAVEQPISPRLQKQFGTK